MLYFVAEDGYYYSQKSLGELRNEYGLSEIYLCPDINMIREAIQSGKEVAFIAPSPPESISPMFKATNFFEIVELKNRHGLLTTGQKKIGISETVALKEKLGIQIHKSNLTLKDYAGAEGLIEEAKKIGIKERYGFPIKGFMLAGIPGTGKSHFAKCMAGETERLLVELNLSLIMEAVDAIYRIGMIFDYFINNPGRYILWIDEIEKMLVGEKSVQMLGQLLTKINDLNSTGVGNENQSSIFVIATANNITDIAARFPEFTRYGRFDLLLFMMPPTEEDAAKIFTLYLNKAMTKFKNEKFVKLFKYALLEDYEEDGTIARMLQGLIISSVGSESKDMFLKATDDVIESNVIYQEIRDDVLKSNEFKFDIELFIQKASVEYGNYASVNRFIYTPAEIEFIVDDVFFSHFFKSPLKYENEDIDEKELLMEYNSSLLKRYQPLQVTLKSAIERMSGAASNFKKL